MRSKGVMFPMIIVAGVLLAASWLLSPLIGGASPSASPGLAVQASIPPTHRVAEAARVVPADRIIDGQPFEHIRGREGFWRIGRTTEGVWWFISPDNRLEWLNTVTTVQPFQLGRRETGPHFVSSDWNGIVGDATTGDLRAWASSTLNRIRAAGFKGLGAWCHPVFHEFDVPITRDLNIWAHHTGQARLLYDPAWKRITEQAIATQVVPLRDNRNLVGYYTDNELDWGDSGAGPARYFDHLPPDDPNRRKVVSVIQRLWPDVERFNAAWNKQLASYDELDALQTLPHEPPAAYAMLFSAWLEQLATDYFRITTELVRQYDPNHLVLGVRFRGNAPREVVRASRAFTDAQSINYYVADGLLDPQMFPMMYAESGQPIILTEYSFHSLDGRSGNRNTFGFAAQVIDQQARADGYRLKTTRLARIPYVIGADWFQWSDEPPSGRTSDGEDVNFGIVDIDDRPYQHLIDAIARTTPLLNDIHHASSRDTLSDVFRQSFDRRPAVNVPYAVIPPRINGELSDWPAGSTLQGLRHSEAIGLDRSPLPLPIVKVAWNSSGVFFGIEVRDNDIEATPVDGAWWTRDSIELFISTRVPQAGQNFYTPHDTQFYFVPIPFPRADGASGAVGRWKRTGDALEATRAPDRTVAEASRVFPDRYVVELFVPAVQLHGFDETGQTPMALNVYVRNFQSAIDYFWSAPKEVQTQLRPGTWGVMNLRPRGAR